MSVKGRVEEIGKSQKGSPKAKVAGFWYFAGKTDISEMKLGQEVELDVHSFMIGTNELWGIDKWKALGPPPPQAAPSPSPGGNGGNPVPQMVSDRALLFVSNCVGSAIQADKVKAPSDILPWALAARAAHKAVEDWKWTPVSDEEIPY